MEIKITQNKLSNIKVNREKVNGTRIVVAAFGILCGLTGIIAGFFEIRQGNITPEGLVISTIGSNYSMADDFTYRAVTIVPNMLITGILAIIFSCLVIIWSVNYVHKKKGIVVLPVLFIMQTLFGGGWIIDLAAITCILAILIDRPLNWWSLHIPVQLHLWLSRLLPFSLVFYIIISLSMLILTILGIDNATLIKPLEILAAAMFIPIVLMIFGGISHDVLRKSNTVNIFSINSDELK